MTDASFVVVEVPVEDVDDALGCAWLAGAIGVEERGADRSCTLLAAVDPAVGPEPLLEALGARWAAEVVVVPTEGLADAWRPYARTVRAGRRIVLQPSWLDAAAGAGVDADAGSDAGSGASTQARIAGEVDDAGADDLVVLLDPGSAFGSGSHPSTRLALAQLEDVVVPGSRVLDVGCGSGVLAIAAALLGAGQVDGIDIDPSAAGVTQANAARNGVADRVRFVDCGLADLEGNYEVVVANILAGTLVELGPLLVERVGSGGVLVLAGLLERDVARVTGAMGVDGPAGALVVVPDSLRTEDAFGLRWAALALHRPS